MARSLFVLACAFTTLLPAIHALQEQVLSSFVYTRHGDRTPLYTSDTSVLTPYGAWQMHNAGANFRNRYLTTTFDDAMESTAIRDISHYQLNPDEVNVLSVDSQYIVASAQAFMQGLYPPLADSSSLNHTELLGISELANGTNVLAPLNGYQYQDVKTVSSYDPRSVWIDGASNCPAYFGKLVDYYDTADFAFLYTSTIEFYQGLEDFLEDEFTANDLGYFNAYYLYDWLQYEALHNSSFHLSAVNMTKAEILAANWVYAMYANASDPVLSIAGRSMASQVLYNFYDFLQNQGQVKKLNLWFGDFAPMASFAALSELTSPRDSIFYDVPPMGSSFIFELFSLLPDDESNLGFPNITDMYVRFYYQLNATEEPIAYSLFGASPSTLLSYSDFVSSMTSFSMTGIKQWCNTCGSSSIFCPAFTNDLIYGSGSSRRKGLSPVVAGVIGALVTLAVAALLFGLLMALAGFRVHRQPNKRKSDLKGFKGSQKLASDQDLTIPKGGAGATIVTTEPTEAKGHERVGSWELREAAKREEAGQAGIVTTPRVRRPSYEDDEIHVNPYAPPVKPHDQV